MTRCCLALFSQSKSSTTYTSKEFIEHRQTLKGAKIHSTQCLKLLHSFAAVDCIVCFWPCHSVTTKAQTVLLSPDWSKNIAYNIRQNRKYPDIRDPNRLAASMHSFSICFASLECSSGQGKHLGYLPTYSTKLQNAWLAMLMLSRAYFTVWII